MVVMVTAFEAVRALTRLVGRFAFPEIRLLAVRVRVPPARVGQYLAHMAADDVTTWNRRPAGDPGADLPPVGDAVQYGPDIADDSVLRLLGSLAGKRVLELGCGWGPNLVTVARQGGHAIGLDSASDQLSAAKRLAEQEGVRVELHHGDLADLAFMRGDSVDLALSSYGLARVDDLNRVFRQVHRVLKQDAPLVFSLPHPSYDLIHDADPLAPLLVRRSYYDHSPLAGGRFHHTFAELFTSLSRAKFRVDTVLEPEPLADGPRSQWWRESFHWIPRTLVIRARKEGI